MCVLAGCDFLPSVPGIGIAKAYALVSKYRNLDRVSLLYLFLNNVNRTKYIFMHTRSGQDNIEIKTGSTNHLYTFLIRSVFMEPFL